MRVFTNYIKKQRINIKKRQNVSTRLLQSSEKYMIAPVNSKQRNFTRGVSQLRKKAGVHY